MINYYLHTIELRQETITNVLRIGDDGVVWTIAEGHRFYDEYLAWVAEGNTAEEWTGN
jgi:hypothetical protein